MYNHAEVFNGLDEAEMLANWADLILPQANLFWLPAEKWESHEFNNDENAKKKPTTT